MNSDTIQRGENARRKGGTHDERGREARRSEQGRDERQGGTTEEKREKGAGMRAHAAASPLGRECRVHVFSPDVLILNEMLPSATFSCSSNDVRM